MARRGPAAVVCACLVLLAGAAAWLALTGEPGSDDPAQPPAITDVADSAADAAACAPEDAAGRAHVATGADEVGDTPDVPTGAIRVVEEDGKVALASVYTTAEPVWVRAEAKHLGGTGTYGFVHPEYRDTEPLAFLWAFAPGRMAGPVAALPGGQTLTLGPGSSIEVHVRRADGTAVAGAMCSAKKFRAQGVTDAEGNATLSGFPSGIDVNVGARVLGSHGYAGADVSLPPDGSPARIELEIDTGAGPFVLVTISGDVTSADEVQVDIAGGELRVREYTVRGGDPPVLVSLRQRTDAVVDLTARSLGYRIARHRVEDLARGSTTQLEFVLVAGGVPRRGRVLNADGSPAAQVRVGPVAGVLEWSYEATDEHGWFDVDVEWIGASIIALRRGEACSTALMLDDEVGEIVLHLGIGATLQGVVRDETTGRPIEKVEVRIAFGPEENDPDWSATSDSSGAYRVSGIPPGTFVLPLIEGSPRARAPENQWKLTGGHERSAPPRERLIAEGNAYVIAGTETITHDLTAIAQRGGECTFRVVLPEGTPLPELFGIEHSWKGARGWRDGRDFERPEDGDPSFTLFLEEGTHRLSVTAPAPTLAQVIEHGQVTAPGLVGVGPEIVVSGDGPLPDVEIVMKPRRRVQARLVDADGAPVMLEGIRIRIAVNGPTGGRSRGDGITNANGVADITNEGPPPEKVDADETFVVFTLDGEGLYTASPWGEDANLRVPGRDWARRMREETSEPWVLDVPITESPRVALRVVDGSGRPAAGVPVRWKRSFRGEWTTGVSDASGTVAIPLADEYDDLEIEATGDWVGGTQFQRSRSGRNEATLTVDRRRTVRVRFVDPSGNALPDTSVIAFVPGVWTERATDETGCIDLDIPASDTAFQVRARGHWPPKNVAAPAGATAIDAVIEPLFPVTFRIVLPPDLERPDRVFVQVGTSRKPHGDTAFADVVADAPIEAVIPLPRRPFPVKVSVDDPFFGGTAHYTGVEDEVTVRVERLPLRTVVLRLEDDEGHPIAGKRARVRARGVLDTELTTDAGGHISVELPPIALDPVVISVEGYEDGRWSFDPGEEIHAPIPLELAPAR